MTSKTHSRAMTAVTLAILAGAWLAPPAAAETEVISQDTPWRVHLTVAPNLARVGGELTVVRFGRRKPTPPSPLPPADWRSRSLPLTTRMKSWNSS